MNKAPGTAGPSVTVEGIEAKIKEEYYYVFPGTPLTICMIILENGFKVTGESAAVSMENFDKAKGEKYARENAFNKIWALEGYLLKEKLHQGELTGVAKETADPVTIINDIYTQSNFNGFTQTLEMDAGLSNGERLKLSITIDDRHVAVSMQNIYENIAGKEVEHAIKILEDIGKVEVLN